MRMIDYLNTAYRVSPEEGAIARTSANYWVYAGKHSATHCIDEVLSHGGSVLTFEYRLHPKSIRPFPVRVGDWDETAVAGRVYMFTVDLAGRDLADGGRQTLTVELLATVLPDGTAKLIPDIRYSEKNHPNGC